MRAWSSKALLERELNTFWLHLPPGISGCTHTEKQKWDDPFSWEESSLQLNSSPGIWTPRVTICFFACPWLGDCVEWSGECQHPYLGGALEVSELYLSICSSALRSEWGERVWARKRLLLLFYLCIYPVRVSGKKWLILWLCFECLGVDIFSTFKRRKIL